jgi:hypothetical protein
MAERPRLKNPTQLFKAMRPQWEAAGFTNFNEKDTKLRALTEPVIQELFTLGEESRRAFLDLQLGTATRAALTDRGRTIGLPKQESQFASVSALESNLAFFVTSGTFGDINGAANIVLPATTLIYSESNENDSGERVTYKLNSAVTLDLADSISFVSATAVTDGSIGNVGAQVLRTHNFTQYVGAAANTLRVINFYPILNGVDQESEERYRARLIAYYRSLQATNFDAVQLQSLDVPGVRSTRLDRGYFGIGTGAVFVNGPEGRSNNKMVAAVQQQLLGSVAPGGQLQALPRIQVTIDLEIGLKTLSVLSSNRQQQIKSLVRNVALNYIRDAQQSSFVDCAELQRRALLELSKVGVTVSKEAFFDRILISRSYGGSGADERDTLVGTSFSLKPNEYPVLGVLSVAFRQ